LAIKNGKVYGSKASAYQILVRPKRDKWNHDGTVLMDTFPPLTAEFAYHGGEFSFHNPLTGSQDVGADIRGHFFDSAQQAEEKGWSQEEHDAVVNAVDRKCKTEPEYVWEVTMAKAEKPWPTYDDTHHNQIATLATTLGLVAEALVYESENKNRDSVTEKLREALPIAPVGDEEFVAA
jgi:hypothetical protein